jgi:hypothetical protein
MACVIEILGNGSDQALTEFLARHVDTVAEIAYRRNGVLTKRDFRLESVNELVSEIILYPVDHEGAPAPHARRVRIRPAWIDTIRFY